VRVLTPAIAYYNVKDVRPTLKHYQGKNIAQEYAKIEAEQKRAATLEWERSHPTSVHGAGSSILSSMFGSVSSVGPPRCVNMSMSSRPARPNETFPADDVHRAEARRVAEDVPGGAEVLARARRGVQEVSCASAKDT